jgi:hypothetical protein
MKYRKQLDLILLSIYLYVLLVGCTVSQEISVQLEDVPITRTSAATREMASVTPSPIPVTQSPTLRPSPQTEPTERLTATPDVLPTLSPEDSEVLKQRMLFSNGDCQLPCWWGIVPGQTDWQTAERFFSRLVDHIGEYEREDGTFVYRVRVLEPDDYGTSAWKYEYDHYFYVVDGIVESIRPVAWPSPDYALSTILNTYGQPDGIWFRSSQVPQDGWLPTSVTLYYPAHGFLLKYWGNGSLEGDIVHRCIEDEPVLDLVTWSSEKERPFAEIIEEFEGPESVQYYLPLEESTGMSVPEFYDTFTDSEDTTCLTSPAVLWPGW